MPDPRNTGISSITGKLVAIRHATDLDRVIVGEYLKQNHDDSDLNSSELVVAVEDDRIIGFAVLKQADGTGCLSVFEDSRRKGIGTSIVRHLSEFAHTERIYATRYASYFTHAGVAQLRKVRASRQREAGKPCRLPLMERLSIPAYQKAS